MQRLGLQKLIEWKNRATRKPLVFKGARQVGKTFLLKEFAKSEFQAFHYFNFEKDQLIHQAFQKSLDPKSIGEQLEFIQKKKINFEKDLIIFDEIQACPLAITSLKYFCEELPNTYICAAGSLLGLYSVDPSFPVGKVEYLYLYPMNFEEFILALGEYQVLKNYLIKPTEVTHSHLWNRYTDYLIVGGLPEAVQSFVDNQKLDLNVKFEKIEDIHNDIVNGYIADMAKHCGKENAMFLQRLWQNSAEKLGENQSEKFKFKGVFPGKKSYADFAGPLDWLSKAGLAYIVPIVESTRQPLSLDKKENVFKIFNFDVGILNYLKAISYTELKMYNFSHKGFIAENFVLQEMVSSLRKSVTIYSYKKGISEIEFLFESHGILRPVEVKAGLNLKAKSLTLFMETHNSAEAIRFSAKQILEPFRNFQYKEKTRINRIYDYPLFLASEIKNM
jgi:predicted AAA+ superfamily ATPase